MLNVQATVGSRSLARAAYWILCGVALLGDYALLSLTVYNSGGGR